MITKTNEVVTEAIEGTDNHYRWFLREISIRGGEIVGENSTVALHNVKRLLDGNGVEIIGAKPIKAQLVTVTLAEFFEKIGMTKEQFALVWADILDEKLNAVKEPIEE